MSNKKPYILTIAGFDPSAGAGVLSDVKTFENTGTYGLAVITSNTIQNDSEFNSLTWVAETEIFSQIQILYKKYQIDYVKIGLVKDLQSLSRIINFLFELNCEVKIIWDPILKATAGKVFHSELNQKLLLDILRRIYLVTPNLEEIKKLFPVLNLSDASLSSFTREEGFNLLLKGGHSENEVITDNLYTGDKIFSFEGQKFEGYSKHGTGCVLSSAITSYSASGFSLEDSCSKAKKYVEKFIISNKTNLGYHK